MEIKLKKPIIKGDSKIDKINLDLDKLTGSDIIAAENESRERGITSPNPLFSSTGLAVLAGRASGIIPDDIIGISAPDFLEVTTVVSNFLYGWTLPGLIPQETSEEQS